MNTSANGYRDILRSHSKSLITQEGRIIVDLLLNVRSSVVSLSLMPFCALFCRSAKEFLRIEDTGNEVEKEVKDIRDGLKIFTDRYSKGRKMAFTSDAQQNKLFRSKLRFSFTKKLNIHLNLGVFFDERGRIVFNTQLSNYYLSIPKRSAASSGEHAKAVGEKLGREVVGILVKHCGLHDLRDKKTLFNTVPKYGYIDFNTNRENTFFSKGFDKETNLMILHLLSSIGFVNNLLIPIFQDKNVWLLRILYITAHNAWLGINKITQHLEQNFQDVPNGSGLARCFIGETTLFSSSFRNCMMHYDLVDKNDHPVILREWYDPDKPLNGLIESCYGGMHFEQYYDKLYKLSQELEEYLLSYFTINQNHICWKWE